ncbi:MAG: DNA repair protein RecN [Deltaproteobacteria bacterium]|nr:DNA repair protein RecN [Deltaproteobacteria bacterium]
MLLDLFIRDFAIIESLHVTFAAGLTMITGETGAGKSILVGALSLLMGGRASADMIRTGSDEAVVEAMFDITHSPEIRNILASYELDSDADQLLIRRIISRTEKNRILVGGRLATIQMLTQLSGMLVDISGQYSQQLLLQAENHIDLLDAYGNLLPLRARYQQEYTRYQTLAAELHSLTMLRQTAERRRELIAFQHDEISRAQLSADEEKSLVQERTVVASAQTLYQKTYGVYTALYEDQQSCLGMLKKLSHELREAAAIDASLTTTYDALESNLLGIEDTALSLRSYADKITMDPARLDQIETRLDELHRLKKKYGKTIPEIITYRDEILTELQSIDGSSTRIDELSREVFSCSDQLWTLAAELSDERVKAAHTLKKKVAAELASIGMKKVSFTAQINSAVRLKAKDPATACAGLMTFGMDTVEFFISPNQGEEPKPLSRIASGGEISRIVLALKKIIAGSYKVPTLLFDEVDAGIGGAVAEAVGIKLKEIAASHQVLCITHLPQIACFGSQHLSVQKCTKNGRTVTSVVQLDADGRVGELSRMLGGMKISEATRKHAHEMLHGAQQAGGMRGNP